MLKNINLLSEIRSSIIYPFLTVLASFYMAIVTEKNELKVILNEKLVPEREIQVDCKSLRAGSD